MAISNLIDQLKDNRENNDSGKYKLPDSTFSLDSSSKSIIKSVGVDVSKSVKSVGDSIVSQFNSISNKISNSEKKFTKEINDLKRLQTSKFEESGKNFENARNDIQDLKKSNKDLATKISTKKEDSGGLLSSAGNILSTMFDISKVVVGIVSGLSAIKSTYDYISKTWANTGNFKSFFESVGKDIKEFAEKTKKFFTEGESGEFFKSVLDSVMGLVKSVFGVINDSIKDVFGADITKEIGDFVSKIKTSTKEISDMIPSLGIMVASIQLEGQKIKNKVFESLGEISEISANLVSTLNSIFVSYENMANKVKYWVDHPFQAATEAGIGVVSTGAEALGTGMIAAPTKSAVEGTFMEKHVQRLFDLIAAAEERAKKSLQKTVSPDKPQEIKDKNQDGSLHTQSLNPVYKEFTQYSKDVNKTFLLDHLKVTQLELNKEVKILYDKKDKISEELKKAQEEKNNIQIQQKQQELEKIQKEINQKETDYNRVRERAEQEKARIRGDFPPTSSPIPSSGSGGSSIPPSIPTSSPIPSSGPEESKSGGDHNSGTNHKLIRAPGVNQGLLDAINSAAEEFTSETGMKVILKSGLRPGDKRQHGKGNAIDINLVKDGKILPDYQNTKYFREYERFAQAVYKHANQSGLGNKLRWGGYFSGTKYGSLDLMHFDLAGDHIGMAGGSWQGGANKFQKTTWKGINSEGLGSGSFSTPSHSMIDAGISAIKEGASSAMESVSSATKAGIEAVKEGASATASKVGDFVLGEKTDVNSRSEYIINKLMKDLGYTREQAAGFVGNLLLESGGKLNPKAVGPRLKDGTHPRGIAQWTHSRFSGLENFAKNKGKSWEDFETQIDYLVWELKNGGEQKANKLIKQSSTLQQATIAVREHFERPSEEEARQSDPQRLKYAQKAFKGEGKGEGVLHSGPDLIDKTSEGTSNLLGWMGDKISGDFLDTIFRTIGGDSGGALLKNLTGMMKSAYSNIMGGDFFEKMKGFNFNSAGDMLNSFKQWEDIGSVPLLSDIDREGNIQKTIQDYLGFGEESLYGIGKSTTGIDARRKSISDQFGSEKDIFPDLFSSNATQKNGLDSLSSAINNLIPNLTNQSNPPQQPSEPSKDFPFRNTESTFEKILFGNYYFSSTK